MTEEFELTFRMRQAMEVFEAVAKMHAVRCYGEGLKDPAMLTATMAIARRMTQLTIRTGFDWKPQELTKTVLRVMTLHYEHCFLSEFSHLTKSYTIYIDKHTGKTAN